MENKGVDRRTNEEVQDLLRQCVEQLEATQDDNTQRTSYEETNPGDRLQLEHQWMSSVVWFHNPPLTLDRSGTFKCLVGRFQELKNTQYFW